MLSAVRKLEIFQQGTIMNLFAVILTTVLAFAHSSAQLSRDFATNIESKHYEFGYQWTSHIPPSIASAFSAQNLARTERDIYKIIRTLLNDNSSSVNQVDVYVKDYEDSALVLAQVFNGEEFIRAVAGNLVSLYRMVRRFRNFIQVWLLPSKTPTIAIGDELSNKLKSIYNVNKGPHKIDFHISMLAFPLLQFHLDIKADQIANGIYNGGSTVVRMEAIHCLEIGLHSVASGFYPIGIEWIEHALEKVNQGDATVSESLVRDYLDKSIVQHDTNWQPFNEKDMVRVFYEKPLNQTSDGSQRKWRKMGNYSRDHEPFPYKDYGGVCKGNIKQSEMETSRLFCWYETSIHPFWKIGPVKSELLTPLPDQIVQFHDVINKNLTKELKKAAEGKFHVSILTKFTKIHPRIQYSGDYKSTTTLWTAMSNFSSPHTFPGVSQLCMLIGGFWFQGSQRITTERLATFIIYLEGSDLGGSTGFPRLKMAAPAIKGSAILWFNVNSAGEHAANTVHGSCPVVSGSKLIAVKWIQYVQQSHLKCDRNKDAGMDYLRNARTAL